MNGLNLIYHNGLNRISCCKNKQTIF